MGLHSENVKTWITTYVAAKIAQYILNTMGAHGRPANMRLYKIITTHF